MLCELATFETYADGVLAVREHSAAYAPAAATLSPPPPAVAAAPAHSLDDAHVGYWEKVPSGPRISKPPPRLSKDWIASDTVLSRAAVSDEEPADATAADTSTTIDTVPDNNGKDDYPNLMLCHTHTISTEEPNDRKKLLGWNRRMKRKKDENLQERASDAFAVAEEELYD
ncbi:hypothetical protein C8Q74DRAFT_1369718 [Fomes fomentarius]|nr:hypothetical protein C8Q74DRAFT_1369718 [Fomes fomentarius]